MLGGYALNLAKRTAYNGTIDDAILQTQGGFIDKTARHTSLNVLCRRHLHGSHAPSQT